MTRKDIMANMSYPPDYRDFLHDPDMMDALRRSGAAQKPTWPMKGGDHVTPLDGGFSVVQKAEPAKLRFTSASDPGKYVEFGFNEQGVFTVTGTAMSDDMDQMAQQFIGAVVARMNKVVR